MVDPPDLGASSLLHGPRHRPAPRHRRPRRRPSATPGPIGPSRRPSRLILVSLFLLSLLGLVAGHVLPQSPPGHAAAAVATTTYSDQVKSQQYRAHYVVDKNDERFATAEAAQDLAQGAALNRFRVAAADTSLSITDHFHRLAKRAQLHKRAAQNNCSADEPMPVGERIAFGILVPVLVILSGIFAGLTLGYMSLDETQLHVLSTTGTEVQRARARKIIPIRKDGHLLLTTLLIANMITNETLPIIFDPLISNPIVSVVASIVLIVIFAELIPQSTCSRYGLVIGAYMAFPTRIVIIVLWPVAFPVSRILHWVLGPHHGIVYRRAELKELVAIHAASGGRGGDLKGDTVMIVGGALDLQEKVVRQAMTPIDSVFMLPFTATLDYPTLEKVVRSGHSRIPIYQEFDVPVAALQNTRSGGATPTKKKLGPLLGSFAKKASADTDSSTLAPPAAAAGATTGEGEPGDDEVKTVKRKKIIGTLLVKSCVLLDPEDAIPVSSMVINALPTVPGDEPLLNVLNAFQEGRSHMAIVSARPRNRTMLNDSIADLGSHSNLYRSSQGPPGQAAAAAAAAPPPPPGASAAPRVDGLGNIDEEKQTYFGRSNSSSAGSGSDSTAATTTTGKDGSPTRAHKSRRSIWSRRLGLGKDGGEALREQSVPSDATITDEKASAAAAAAAAPPLSAMPQLTPINSRMSASAEDHHGWPLGIITLEDVLEELLGEEILDEYDDRGNEEQDFRTLNPPPSPEHIAAIRNHGDKAVQPGADDGGVGAAAAAAGDGDKGAPGVVAKDTHTLALPAAALGASHGAAADDAATVAAATTTTATSTTTSKPTVLNRLGITRRRSAKDPTQGQGQSQGQGRNHQNSQRQASDSEPQLGAGVSRRRTETDVAPASPLVASPVPVATDTAAPPLPLDYFGATAARSRPPRSSSVPPTAPGSSYSSAGVTPAHSRPPSPAGAPGAALKSPANRPVVIRTQDPSSGVQKTTIASEGLLRGRQQTTAAAAAAAAASSSTSGAMTPPIASSAIPSRSQTPAGEGGASSSRGSRFKSQAAGGHLIGGQWISPQSSARKTSGGTKQQPVTNRSMTAALAQQDLSDSIGSLRSSDQPESTVEHTGADDGDGGGDSTPPSRAH